ncbi:hypothetical protein J2X46_004298 [Nocardioides sp. BE266]|uniref:hypothetical protein n=1 Tax=Nocardioides sp. BE266 TaxID=2817725 RepID=UPI00286470B0|nr:hypothetical protein [Nocardioides sp. BE266]MDR7255296.1 hypothetical protein [Nocardioides sp. BE266]
MLTARTLARRLGRVIAVVALATGTASALPAPAQADPIVPIDWKVDVTSHLVKLNKDLVVPTGTFKGGFDVATWQLTGALALPEATSRLDLGSLPLAKVTLAMEQTAPVTGGVDLFTMTGTARSTFNVRILAIRPMLTPWVNLVNPACVTRTPVVADLGGKVDLQLGSTFTGTYDLPKFTGCGLGVTAIVNQIVSGSGNSLTAKFTPAH